MISRYKFNYIDMLIDRQPIIIYTISIKILIEDIFTIYTVAIKIIVRLINKSQSLTLGYGQIAKNFDIYQLEKDYTNVKQAVGIKICVRFIDNK